MIDEQIVGRTNEETNNERPIIKPVSLSINLGARKLPLDRGTIEALDRDGDTEPYEYGVQQESYLITQIEEFIRAENLLNHLDNPNVETILWLSHKFMRASTGEHNNDTVFDEKGIPAGRTIEAYISTLSKPETVCIVFNAAYIRVFETLSNIYNPDLLDFYKILPVSAKSSVDLIRRNSNRDFLRNREQAHLFLTMVSQDETGKLLATPIDPYHAPDNFELEGIDYLDFSKNRAGEVTSGTNLVTQFNARDKSTQINLQIDSSNISLESKIGLAIQSTWLVTPLDELLERQKYWLERRKETLRNIKDKETISKVDKTEWDLTLESIFEDIFSDTNYYDLGTALTEDELVEEILSLEKDIQSLESFKALSFSNILTTLDTFFAEWDGEDPVSLELVAELIDNVWLHHIYLPEDYYYKAVEVLRRHVADPDVESGNYIRTVRKHGNYDQPKFVLPPSDTESAEFRSYELGIDVKIEYFIWLARQDLTEWVNKLPRLSSTNKHYSTFLKKLNKRMIDIGYDSNTNEGRKLSEINLE